MNYKSMIKFRINIEYFVIFLKRCLSVLYFILIFTIYYYGETI